MAALFVGNGAIYEKKSDNDRRIERGYTEGSLEEYEIKRQSLGRSLSLRMLQTRGRH